MKAGAGRILFIAALLALAGAATTAVRPTAPAVREAPDLEAMLPEAFGGWRRIALSDAVLPAETELTPGEAVAYRAYEDELGRVVTLVAAYGPPLGDSVRLHRPEACYVAQGFAILSRAERDLDFGGRAVRLVDLDAQSPSRREGVTYWLRDGDSFTTKASDSGWRRLRRGAATPLDGALLRVSTLSAEAPQFDLHGAFLGDFAAALGPDARRTLLGEEARS